MKEISMKEEIKELVTCPYCNGTGGHEDRKMRDPLAKGIDPQAWVDCPDCDGSGEIEAGEVEECEPMSHTKQEARSLGIASRDAGGYTYVTTDGRRCDNCNAPFSDHKDRIWCPCGTCDGSGAVDSGGVLPWGEPAMMECPECLSLRANVESSHAEERSDLELTSSTGSRQSGEEASK